jgi:uncharacterized BrkB/YihY/UPF0761 family membrane protein
MLDSSLPHPDIAITPTVIVTSDTMEKPRRGVWRRVLRPLILILTAQYTIVLLIGLSVAGTVRALVLPQILSSFETIAAAMRRAPF